MINCTKCQSPLSNQAINAHSLVACPQCRAVLRADVYPALYRPSPGNPPGETIHMGKEAGCFYHPRKKATVPCSACGRFLCALCSIALDGQHLCPQCLEIGKTKRKIENLENRRTCYDTIALLLATVPILIYWVTIVTAPVTIYLTLRYWKFPSSIIPRTKVRFVFAFIIAGLQTVGWVLIFSSLLPLTIS